MRNLSVTCIEMLAPKSVNAPLPWLVCMVSQLLSIGIDESLRGEAVNLDFAADRV